MRKHQVRKMHTIRGIVFKGNILCDGETIKRVDGENLEEFIKTLNIIRRKCR